MKVALFRRKASPYLWLRFTCADHPKADRRGRVFLSTRTADRAAAKAQAADFELLLETRRRGKLNETLFRQLVAGDPTLVSKPLSEWFTEIADEEAALVRRHVEATDPTDARKRGGLAPQTARRYARLRRYLIDHLTAPRATGTPQINVAQSSAISAKSPTNPAEHRVIVCNLTVADIDLAACQGWKQWMRAHYATGTYRVARVHLSGLWDRAVAVKWCERNPWRDRSLRPAKDPKRAWPILNTEQRHRLLALPDDDWRHRALKVMLLTGCRPSDLCGLRRGDVELERGRLRFLQPKTGEVKYVPIAPSLRLSLEAQLASHQGEWMFPKITRTQILDRFEIADPGATSQEETAQQAQKCPILSFRQSERAWLDTTLGRLMRKLGLPTPYCLRRTFATALLDAGTNKRNVQRWLGHKDSKITDLYDQGSGVDAAGALAIDEALGG